MTMQQMLFVGKSNAFVLTIPSNTSNFVISDAIKLSPYFWDGISATQVTLTINSSVIVSSTSTSSAALDTGLLPTGSSLNLTNLGSIIGRGGVGGNGEGDDVGGNGTNGGTAFAIAAALSGHVTITNGSGLIGGGGGGGGGGAVVSGNHGAKTPLETLGGGGAGGGAGSGAAGSGGNPTFGDINSPGVGGNPGTNSGPGTGAPPEQLSGFAGRFTTGAGGNGGDFGANGSNGYLNGIGAGNPGTGGVAGKAIELNGGAAPTFVSGGTSPNLKGAIS